MKLNIKVLKDSLKEIIEVDIQRCKDAEKSAEGTHKLFQALISKYNGIFENFKEEIESLSKNQIDTICRNIKKLCKLESKIVEAKSTENGIVYLINYATEYIDEYGGISYRKFVPIEEDILKFLIDTSSSNAIKTYIYLKYRCADKDYNSKETKITRMEIANNIGLSVKSDNNLKTVRNIVKSLENNKLIKTSKRYVTEVSSNGNEVVKCYKFFKVKIYCTRSYKKEVGLSFDVNPKV